MEVNEWEDPTPTLWERNEERLHGAYAKTPEVQKLRALTIAAGKILRTGESIDVTIGVNPAYRKMLHFVEKKWAERSGEKRRSFTQLLE
jgi:hypothetical protein